MKKLTVLLTILAAFSCSPIQAETNYGMVEVDRIVDVYDGDTFFITQHDWPAIFGNRLGVRIAGIDTPEIRGGCDTEKQLAQQARAYVEAALKHPAVVTLHNIHRGKYFRLVADVEVDGVSLGEQLINQQHARPYDGKGPRKPWCSTR